MVAARARGTRVRQQGVHGETTSCLGRGNSIACVAGVDCFVELWRCAQRVLLVRTGDGGHAKGEEERAYETWSRLCSVSVRHREGAQ